VEKIEFGQGMLQNTSGLPCQYYSANIISHHHLNATRIRRTNGRSLQTCGQNSAVSMSGNAGRTSALTGLAVNMLPNGAATSLFYQGVV